MSNITPAQINAQIAKGAFRPHTMLSHMALNYFQSFNNYFARGIFPIVRVRMSADNYVRWSLEDLLRNNWQMKPAYGKVTPTVIGEDSDTYAVKVYQDIRGIDEIRETDISRRQQVLPLRCMDQRVVRRGQYHSWRKGVHQVEQRQLRPDHLRG